MFWLSGHVVPEPSSTFSIEENVVGRKLTTAKAEDLEGGGGHIRKPGMYHFLVDEVKEGLSSKDKPMSGTTLMLTCLAGTVDGCEDQKANIVLWDPKEDGSEGDKICNRALTNYFLAANLLKPDQLGGTEVELDEQATVQAQVIMKLAYKQKRDDNGNWVDAPKEGVQLSYADIFHVDDPAVAEIPKHEDAIGLIPPEHRHDAEWFSFKKKKGSAGSSKQEKAAAFDASEI